MICFGNCVINEYWQIAKVVGIVKSNHNIPIVKGNGWNSIGKLPNTVSPFRVTIVKYGNIAILDQVKSLIRVAKGFECCNTYATGNSMFSFGGCPIHP